MGTKNEIRRSAVYKPLSMMSRSSDPGEIITFYSYKGGTGRSMALANVGCLLAMRESQKGRNNILLVDWDLEAPGLHRFFRDQFKHALHDVGDYSAALNQHQGLIDLFVKIQSQLRTLPSAREEPPPETEQVLRDSIRLEDFILESDLPHLHFLKAGRFDG
jgi:cellulose biosynthesis protein BcsQ